jgi:hypothetical protein
MCGRGYKDANVLAQFDQRAKRLPNYAQQRFRQPHPLPQSGRLRSQRQRGFGRKGLVDIETARTNCAQGAACGVSIELVDLGPSERKTDVRLLDASTV